MAEDYIKRMFCNWDQLFVLSQDFVERFEKRLQKEFLKEQNSTKQVLTPSLAAYAKTSIAVPALNTHSSDRRLVQVPPPPRTILETAIVAFT